MPDDIDQLITEFRRRGSAASLAWKLGVGMDLERVPDDRIVPFLVEVLVDRRQPIELRLHLLKRIRNGRIRPEENGRVRRGAGLPPERRRTSTSALTPSSRSAR